MIESVKMPDTAALQALEVVVMEKGYGYFSKQESTGEVRRGLLDPVGAVEQDRKNSV